MRITHILTLILAEAALSVAALSVTGQACAQDMKTIALPAPRLDGTVSVEKALAGRRSIREFTASPITIAEVSQLLWAAQGINGTRGDRELRTAPSAGALYGLETYILAANVTGLAQGLYRYTPKGHTITFLIPGDMRAKLSDAALKQSCLTGCAAVIVFATVYERISKKYVERGVKFAHMEAGHSSQNVYLEAEALGIGTVAVGSFMEGDVKNILGLPEDQEPLYMMPVGRK
jgi:SagB-type dehydrogenase family enzyme